MGFPWWTSSRLYAAGMQKIWHDWKISQPTKCFRMMLTFVCFSRLLLSPMSLCCLSSHGLVGGGGHWLLIDEMTMGLIPMLLMLRNIQWISYFSLPLLQIVRLAFVLRMKRLHCTIIYWPMFEYQIWKKIHYQRVTVHWEEVQEQH